MRICVASSQKSTHRVNDCDSLPRSMRFMMQGPPSHQYEHVVRSPITWQDHLVRGKMT